MSMLCYQCEQTAKGTGCTVQGVCGKSPTVAALLDVLTEVAKGVSQYAHRAAELGVQDKTVNIYVIHALFATITNVDFDPARIIALIHDGVAIRAKAKALYEQAAATKGAKVEILTGPAVFTPAATQDALVAQAETVGIQAHTVKLGPDLAGLIETAVYGLKGAAAYADHAQVLGFEDAAIYAGFHKYLALTTQTDLDVPKVLAAALEVGALNLKVMELLDKANNGTYGTQVPTPVRVTAKKGKAILVTGHDLKDLELLLKQTEGKGINIYTHGEMLTSHAYPELKKYPHLAGNWGGAWQDQQKEFPNFPGPMLFTTNCIQKPIASYIDRVFTTGLVAWPEVKHIGADKNFAPLIASALAQPGFAADEAEKTILVGFGHGTVLGVADKVIDAVKAGAIRHFFLIGGCDGAKPGRNYYSDFADQVPKDCMILTLACGKYRFNKKDFGTVAGLPRLLDMGQCNDAYSAIKVAVALAGAFNCGVNELPLSLILSWYEQKACAILLTLLHLGIKNIRIGPSLPAFLTPAAVKVLVDAYGLKPIGTASGDLKDILKAA